LISTTLRDFLRGLGAHLLDAAGQRIVPFTADDRVAQSRGHLGMAGDLADLDGAPADVLPPCDAGAAGRAGWLY
jgi:hypothetical protein